MWIRPKEVLVSGPLWYLERANTHFVLQGRKGRGEPGALERHARAEEDQRKGNAASTAASTGAKPRRGMAALLVGTWDSVMDTRPPSYRSEKRRSFSTQRTAKP